MSRPLPNKAASRAAPGPAASALLPGQIIAAYGRRYLVQTESGPLDCVPRGKRSEYACGDRVAVGLVSPGQGVIEAADPRSTLFFRSAPQRTKLIAANATQVLIVAAVEPSFSDELIARALVAAENAGMKSLLVLNKCDLAGQAAAAAERLQPFEAAGYRLLRLSALQDAGMLREHLAGESTVLIGQSGMGKSTIINSLFPEARAATREISTFLASGKHTTTRALMYRMDESSTLIDCPGMQEFGLSHLDWRAIAAGFIEFRPLLDQCRFHDCHHLREPGCAVSLAAEEGRISTRRLELYRRIASAEAAFRRS